MRKVGEVLPFTLFHLGIKKKFEEQSITLHWREIAGEEIYAHSRAASLFRGTLLVVVDNSVWCHHLAISKNDIIHKLNTYAGEKLVTDIRFKAGILKDYQNYENDTHDEGVFSNLRFVKLSAQETEDIDQKIKGLQNKTLSQRIKRVLKKDRALYNLHLSQGWKKCKGCSVLCPPGEMVCASCSRQDKQQRMEKIRTILQEVPWILFEEMQSFIACTRGEYISCKQYLQEMFAVQIRNEPDSSLPINFYIMLTRGVKPDQITDDMIESSLLSLRRKKYVFTPGG